MSAAKNRWAYVMVWQALKPASQPIHVNVFGYPTQKEAEARRRATRKRLRDSPRPDIAVLADRVRPIIDDEFISDLNAALRD